MIETSIFVGDLRTHVGSRRDVHLEISGKEFHSATVRIVDDVICDLTLESVSHGIVVRGNLQADYSAVCSYGLVDIVEPFNAVVNELFEEVKHQDEISDDSHNYQYFGENIDINQMLRDAIITSLPLVPVCGHGPEDCSICSSQITPFIDRDAKDIEKQIVGNIDDVLGSAKDIKDPRWAALDDINFDDIT